MAEKKGAGGKPQEFNTKTGRYGDGTLSTVNYNKGTDEKLLHLKRIYETVDTYDEPIPRSLSAKAKNYDIRMPDGSIAHIEEGTNITNKQVFAGAGTKTSLRMAETLAKRYGGRPEKWAKVKAVAVLNHRGKTGKAEIHWCEEPTAGKHEFKLKVQPNGDWWL